MQLTHPFLVDLFFELITISQCPTDSFSISMATSLHDGALYRISCSMKAGAFSWRVINSRTVGPT